MKKLPPEVQFNQKDSANGSHAQSVLHDIFASWSTWVLVLLCSLTTGLIVNFANHLHYDSQLLRESSQSSVAQVELGKEQSDVKMLIDNGTTQFNCYILLSDYARNICYAHENISNSARM